MAFHLCDSGSDSFDDGGCMLDFDPRVEDTLKTLLDLNEIPEVKEPSSECKEITQVCAWFVYEHSFVMYQ